ncbi:MAG: ABC transporter ATP-binding protein [Spirochaetales bacterium]|nr:ABC transporter ATP-binding protein [Spirochaetales bacterium]
MNNGEALLQVMDLSTRFHTAEGTVRAVDRLSLHINRGEVLGVVGESGCGKSVTALSILRLIPIPPGEIHAEEISFARRNLLTLSNQEMRRIRGNSISMIFQEPMTSLNPVFKVGDQIAEAIRLHQGASRRQAWEQSVELLRIVGISSPEIRANAYPHQMSGGMRQRAMIAMAFSCKPDLLIADEPTTALDVTIQAQILELMREMKENTGSAVMFITHNLGIVAENAQRVLVMYAGQAVESAPVKELFNRPLHPYTIGLLNSIPRREKKSRGKRLASIRGIVPSLLDIPAGCPFRERCSESGSDACKLEAPRFLERGAGHWVRCWKYG